MTDDILARRSDAYDTIARYLRNNLDDDDWADYSAMLETLYAVPPCSACADAEGRTPSRLSGP